eukprot:354060-Chlamydomonas_euryale.AAC.13
MRRSAAGHPMRSSGAGHPMRRSAAGHAMRRSLAEHPMRRSVATSACCRQWGMVPAATSMHRHSGSLWFGTQPPPPCAAMLSACGPTPSRHLHAPPCSSLHAAMHHLLPEEGARSAAPRSAPSDVAYLSSIYAQCKLDAPRLSDPWMPTTSPPRHAIHAATPSCSP